MFNVYLYIIKEKKTEIVEMVLKEIKKRKSKLIISNQSNESNYKIILDLSFINLKDKNGWTALHWGKN